MPISWKLLLFPAALAFSAVLLGCGSSMSSPSVEASPSTPSADFSLSVSPATIALIMGGAAQTIQVAAAAMNGFTGPIALAVSGLPGGLTATPATVSLITGAPQTISFMAAQPAASGILTLTGTSGSLSHSAQVAFSVQAPPDFAFTAAPAAVSLTAGGGAQSIQISAAAVNGFTGTVNVTLSGLPAGVSASPATAALTPGTPQNISLTAAQSTPAGTATVTLAAVSGALSHNAQLALTVTVPVANNDVTTYHNDISRTGQNLKEAVLTLTNVNPTAFGKTNFLSADGKVDAEPLYLQNLMIGGTTHNVLYAATEHDSVYAFDADTGTQLWTAPLLGTGETTSDDHGCGQITPEIGATATPVIDRSQGPSGTIFLVAMSKDGSGQYHQRLHALDVTTGAEQAGSPVEIQASYPGSGAASSGGNVIFDPGQYAERAGLLLLNGSIYTGWTSHCDIQPYTGWLMAYSESTLRQTAVLNLTPNGNEGSVWMSGAGLAADTNGDIYLLDANGTFDTTLDSGGFPNKRDFGNAFLKISTAGGGLAVADYFALDNTVSESGSDQDLGSGGALLLPDLTDSAGQVHQLAVGAGKDSNIYIVDRNNMGKFNANTNGAIYQELTGAAPGGVYSAPAYFNNVVYYGGNGDPIAAFPIADAKLLTTPSAVTGNSFVYPGPTPGISGNGTSNGIVWAVENTSPAVLYAYRADNLQKLYDSTQAPGGRDSFGAGNKFITPLIVNGKVYAGTTNGVAVFGLLP